MKKGRMEAFSDGVIAIIITIMVLELKVPHGDSITDLLPLIPVFISYVLSFIYIGIYWNNHHHLIQVVEKVNGKILWANMHLLFWLSLTPFVTAWMGENGFAEWPVALYGVNLLMASIAYYILSQLLIVHHGSDSILSKAVGSDTKGKISSLLYLISIPLAFYNSFISFGIYITVAIIWLIPDSRIEKTLTENNSKKNNQ